MAALITLFVFFAVALMVAPVNVFAAIGIALLSIGVVAFGERAEPATE